MSDADERDLRAAKEEFFKTGRSEPVAEASSEADRNPTILKMAERPDWTLFRTIDGLQQKAGVEAGRLRRLALKELADNALDEGTAVEADNPDGEGRAYVIADDGPGLAGSPQRIADLFSIRRPMRSSKLLRLPRRGALGNGLRVVAGAVLASEGSLVVATRDKRITLMPEPDGTTRVVEVEPIDFPVGTRIGVTFGRALPADDEPLLWAHWAIRVAGAGKRYEGKSSPHWYDLAQFHELLLAYGRQPLRGLIAELDGCTGAKAGEIVAAAGLDRRTCESVTRAEAKALLSHARAAARQVRPDRLGSVGREAFSSHQYGVETGSVVNGAVEPKAEIPFVAEAWATKTGEKGGVRLRLLVNRTPATSFVSAYRSAIDNKRICLMGCGLSHAIADSPTTGGYEIIVNLTTPYCPITSDGKAPNLEPFARAIAIAISTATRKAQRAAPKPQKVSQKDVILDHLDAVIAQVSNSGEYRFNERQLLYRLRPIVFAETGQELKEGNFKSVITDYETEHGDIPGMYREPRGSIYHPHRSETITLGTLTVEDYERPEWTFNKALYNEKEGFNEALKADGWPERHDCQLISSKGFSTRAAKDLIDKLAAHDEPITVFCVHGADAYGTMIYQTFQEATRARGARKIQIVNLGLEPWEAMEAGLEVELVSEGDKHKAVADYVLSREHGHRWDGWLQTHRVELNAMTTPEFIAWLDGKMEEHGAGKLVPPPEVIAQELEEKLEARVRSDVTARILREANLEVQITEVLNEIARPSGDALVAGIRDLLEIAPAREWRDHVDAEVERLAGPEDSHSDDDEAAL